MFVLFAYRMKKKKRKKQQGRFCKICFEIKPNEKFSGKGHAKHICKSCASLSIERRNELQYLNRAAGISMKPFISKEDKSLLEKYAKDDRYPELKEYARTILDDFDDPVDITGDIDTGYDDMYDYADIDNLPVFSGKKKFTELDNYEKTLLRNYIRSEIIEQWEYSNLYPNEQELIEIKKRMISVFEEECHIILKNDATLRKFFQDNATSAINKLQKKTGDSPEND